jgi:hypothetical protein
MKIHWEEVRRLAEAHTIENPSSSLDALKRYLEFWWCKTYNRPLKDPVLLSYTIDELCYEFLRHFYSDPENDPVKAREQVQAKESEEDWVRKQFEQIQTAQAQVSKVLEKIEEKSKDAQEAASPMELPEFSTNFDE